MKKYNLAQIGTFDLENFGDLLFTTVLQKQMEKYLDIERIFLFSPNACETVPLYRDGEPVYAIRDLEKICAENEIDAIIIGGGDLIRLDSNYAPTENYETSSTTFDMILYPALVADKYHIPLLWNAPGVPFPFAESQYSLIRALLKQVDYISVRDARSKEFLDRCGGKVAVHHVPDSIMTVADLIEKDDPAVCGNLTARYPFLNGNYIVFQSCINESEDYIDTVLRELGTIAEQTQKPIVFLPIGYVHGDDKYLNRLVEIGKNPNFCGFRETLNVYETLTVLAHADAFIGTSLHGNVVANAYGVPSMTVNFNRFVKVAGYFEATCRTDYHLERADGLAETFFNLMSAPKMDGVNALKQQARTHFETLADMIRNRQVGSKDAGELFHYCCAYNPETALTQNKTIFYSDQGNGFSERHTRIYPFTENFCSFSCEIALPEGTKSLRIDPAENGFCCVTDFCITANGQPLSFECNGFVRDNMILFYDNDPQITVATSGLATVHIAFGVFIIPDRGKPQTGRQNADCLHTCITSVQKSIRQTDVFIRERERERNENLQNIAQLQALLTAANNSIDELRNSFFWRITEPARRLSQAVKDLIAKYKT